MKITKRKVVESVLKNHKSFSIKIDIYRDISVQNRPLSAHFRPVTFWSSDRVPPNSVGKAIDNYPHCVQISAEHAKWLLSYFKPNIAFF